jgi:hypothetical protein
VILIPKNDRDPITILHQSFRDFLLHPHCGYVVDPGTCGDRLWISCVHSYIKMGRLEMPSHVDPELNAIALEHIRVELCARFAKKATRPDLLFEFFHSFFLSLIALLAGTVMGTLFRHCLGSIVGSVVCLRSVFPCILVMATITTPVQPPIGFEIVGVVWYSIMAGEKCVRPAVASLEGPIMPFVACVMLLIIAIVHRRAVWNYIPAMGRLSLWFMAYKGAVMGVLYVVSRSTAMAALPDVCRGILAYWPAYFIMYCAIRWRFGSLFKRIFPRSLHLSCCWQLAHCQYLFHQYQFKTPVFIAPLRSVHLIMLFYWTTLRLVCRSELHMDHKRSNGWQLVINQPYIVEWYAFLPYYQHAIETQGVVSLVILALL